MGDINDFYYDLLNINSKEINIKIIKDAVNKNKQEVLNITDDIEGFCKYMLHNISIELSEQNISNNILNTKELLNTYEHEFLIAYYKNKNTTYILIDPTFEEFNKKAGYIINEKLNQNPADFLNETEKGKQIVSNLNEIGYTIIEEADLNLYLNSFKQDSVINEFKFKDIITDNMDVKRSR